MSAAFGPAGGRSDCFGAGTSGCASGLPHSTQNFMLGWFSVPHRLHARSPEDGDAAMGGAEGAAGGPHESDTAPRATGVGSATGDGDGAARNPGAGAPAIREPHCWQ